MIFVHIFNNPFQEKYNTAEQDAKQHLERFKELEMQLKEYQSHCDWKPNGGLVQRNPVAPKPNVSDNISPSTSQKTFNLQEPVSEGIYRIVVNTSSSSNKDKLVVNNTNNNRIENGIDDGVGGVRPRDLDGTKNQSFSATKQEIMQIPNTNPVFKPLITKHYNGSLILNSVENFQIVPKIIKRIPDEEESVIEAQPLAENNKNQVAPLGAPKHKSSSSATKSEPQMAAAAASNATSSNIRTGRESGRSSTSNSPPLAVPPKQKKLPENVAPYPENFEDLLQKSNNEQSKNGDVHETKNTGNAKASPLKSSNNNQNYDFGGVGDHDAKNMDNMNDDSNLPNEDLNNFFDTDNDSPKDHNNKQKNLDDTVNNDDDDGGIMAGDNEGDGGAAAGDIAVKHNQQLLDDTLKNEIAEDQGKEFGDGLRLDEGEGGALEEDDDGK